MWDSVDRRRELWPLTVTIALNLLRDRGRVANKDDLVGEMPEMRALTDVETAGIARMELAKVREAMDQLSESHRSILMREVGGHIASTLPDGAADKMLRMRARRKLRSALEKVSGLVALRLRRFTDLFEGLVALRETGITAASCAFCLALGVGSTVVAPGLVPKASAGPVREGQGSAIVVGTARSATVTMSRAVLRQAIASARAAGAGAPLAEYHDPADRPDASARAKPKRTVQEASEGDLVRTLPIGGDGDSSPNTGALSVDSDNDRPPLPVGDGDEAPPLPPAPDPPAPPAPPPAPAPPGGNGDDSTDPLGGATEVVEQLL